MQSDLHGVDSVWCAVTIAEKEARLFETILVAYDDPASDTLARAAELAESVGGTLVVTNVAGRGEGEPAGAAARTAAAKLEQARATLADHALRVEYVPAVGAPAEEIVRLAHERGADLIVVGTRRKRFIERLVEGSVLHEVVRRATCDVLVVS